MIDTTNKCASWHEARDDMSTYQADRCWGTRECDPCSCGGDETKCDFYPEKRSKAMKKTEKLAPQTNIVWHKGSRLPKKNGEYLCCQAPYYLYDVFWFATDLSDVDDDFAGLHRPGFYGSDSEWGYYEVDNVAWRAEISPECPGKPRLHG